MEQNNERKVYKYGENYYTFKEIHNLYENSNYKKETKDCICNFILAEILKRGELAKEGEALDSLTSYRVKHIGKSMNKSESFLYNRIMSLMKFKILGLAAIKNSYKASELMNGEWILNKLVSLTLGANYPINQIDDFVLINCMDLSSEQCIAIAENFIRNIWNEELIQYKNSKTYSKKSRWQKN